MTVGSMIVQIERARNRLLSVDPGDKKVLLKASRRVDKLILEYYRAKFDTKAARVAVEK